MHTAKEEFRFHTHQLQDHEQVLGGENNYVCRGRAMKWNMARLGTANSGFDTCSAVYFCKNRPDGSTLSKSNTNIGGTWRGTITYRIAGEGASFHADYDVADGDLCYYMDFHTFIGWFRELKCSAQLVTGSINYKSNSHIYYSGDRTSQVGTAWQN
eukprot:scaffold14343_cov102-Cylindrotheca_fusiformis.AAC.1